MAIPSEAFKSKERVETIYAGPKAKATVKIESRPQTVSIRVAKAIVVRKSFARNSVWVRLPPPAPTQQKDNNVQT